MVHETQVHMETAADFNGQTWKLASYAEDFSYAPDDYSS